MPSPDPEQRRLIGVRAIATRWGDTETAGNAGRDLRALQLADHIRTVVAAAPPLTTEQRDRLAVLLRGAPSA